MSPSRAPYGLEIIQSCLTCPVREEGLFCNLGPTALTALEQMRQKSVYPQGTTLYVEGQKPRGIFVLCTGSVKLTASSARGAAVIVRVAEQNEVLGLSAVLAGTPYEVTAETLEPTEVNFLPQEAFLRFLQQHGDVAVRVAQHLGMELRRAYRQVRRLALAPSARAKLAGLLAEWAQQQGRRGESGVVLQLRLNHGEIGELIGSSRETVTRLLGELRRKGLIEVQGSRLLIPDLARLDSFLE